MSRDETPSGNAPNPRRVNQKVVTVAMDLFDIDKTRIERVGGNYVPISGHESLTPETVKVLMQLIPQGVLDLLAQRGGWQEREVVIEGRRQRLMMSDPRLLKHLPFQYGPRSIEAVLFGFNQLAPKEKLDEDYKKATPMEPVYLRQVGDVLVHYIVNTKVMRLRTSIWQYFDDNPLTRIKKLKGSQRDLEAAVHWVLLGPLEPLLPWLFDEFRKSWFLEFGSLWNSREQSRHFCSNWLLVLTLWREIALEAGLVQHLIPFVKVYRDVFEDREIEARWCVKFEHDTKRGRLMDRAILQTQWANALREILALEQVYVSIHAKPPAERGAGEEMFMEAWEKHHMNSIARRVEGYIRELLNVIN